MGLKYPKRNGKIMSFKSVTLLQGATLFEGLQGVTVTANVEGDDPVYGAGTKALGRTRGELHVEFTVTLLAEEFFAFNRSNPGILDLEFSFTVLFEEGAKRGRVEIVAGKFNEIPIEAEGTGATTIELSGTALDCLIDGVSIMLGDATSGALVAI